MRGREALNEMLAAGKPKDLDSALPIARPAGAVKAMNLGLQRLSDEAAAAKSLRATLATAEQVIEIEPSEIEVSFVRDRFTVENDPSFESLKGQISARGQQVPILVRPHPDDPRRYQAAYGHRRLRAAADLGRKVKAIVRNLTDDELVIAQGQENGERRDLSFIERALFASLLEKRAFDRETITAALGVDKPELSRLLGVVAVVDPELIRAMGPAPKVGRPRWLLLAEIANNPKAAKLASDVAASKEFAALDSNMRFGAVLSALRDLKTQGTSSRTRVAMRESKAVAWIERFGRGARLVTKERAFATFLENRLPLLLREFGEQADVAAAANAEAEFSTALSD